MMAIMETSSPNVSVAAGEAFEVQLDEPLTGYKWKLVGDGHPVAVVTGESFGDAKTSAGAGRSHVWAFRAKEPGAAVIRFEYRRPWDSLEIPAGRAFAVNLKVSG